MTTFLLFALSLLSTQQPGLTESGIIGGQILDIHGSPAAGVRVAAIALAANATVNPGPGTLSRLRETDSEGRYRLENVPPGRYLIMAGFAQAPSYYPGVKTPSEAQSVTIAAGQQINSLDFKLPRPTNVRIRGRLDVPFAALQVTLSRVDGSESSPVAVAPDGTFEIANLLPMDYVLRVAGSIAPGVRVDTSDGDVEDIVLVSAPFLGQVVVDDGSPLPVIAPASDATGIQVRIARRSGGIGVTFAIRQSVDVFEFPATMPGEYDVSVPQLPAGYYVKSMTFGNVDLTKGPLTLESVARGTKKLSRQDFMAEVMIVLTKALPAAQGK